MEQPEIEAIEERAEAVLGRVPSWIWDGETLPVPVDSIADSVFSLLVREVEDMSDAPGCPELEPGQSISGLLLASRGEIWVNAEEAASGPGGAGSRSATSSATGSFTGAASSRSSAAAARSRRPSTPTPGPHSRSPRRRRTSSLRRS